MSYVPRFQNAYKLLDKISKRRSFFQTSMNCLYHISSHRRNSKSAVPVYSFDLSEYTISWTSKISSMLRKNRPQEAIGLFKTMLMNNQRPNFVTMLSVIKVIGEMGLRDMVRVIHGFAVKMGFVEVLVVTALVGVYSAWDMRIAWKLFEETPNKDVVLWSAMVSACVTNGDYVEAFELFKKMQFWGLQPNLVTVVSILPACADLGVMTFGKELHGFSIKRVIYSHTNLQNSLVDMYAKCGNLKASFLIFNRMLKKDIVSWRSIIHACLENECPEKALFVFSKMRSYTSEMDGCIMRKVIGASSQLDEHLIGQGLHGLVLKMGYIASVSMVTALLQVYASFGSVGSATVLFDQLNQKDVVAWSVMIAAYVQGRLAGDAFDTSRQMQLADQKPNEAIYVSLLRACSLMAAQEIGESIHAHLTKAGYLSNTFLTSALIDMYCKFGRVRQGKAIFDENHLKDFICWSSMINGYGINGCGDEVLECFANMLSCGIEPNDVVFISVLSACSHCGLEYEGWNWFNAMEEIYGITPKLAHYACMVDMLSRQGNIEEALEFVNDIPVKPDKRIWGALLAGSRKAHGSVDISESIAKQIINSDPKNTSYYVSLSNLYAEQARWDEVEKLRRLINQEEFKKEMGYSMI
ncbi:pentatricopeptide repeat-containing protein At1g11290, chloroplastic-like [Olea europaea var. sylvestris]|uniref:pentatricopeptide repeat-containing protein At1g11290, chloroplastic-like n=1 Tax=Olea europaea var. sylvestris TaxID=158386 RepID=UPI000C1D3A84|nr:pentatricopeptide repeat-containing protein At1g11290, chloroplastic-like [Olea europaea var. sylvestris]XP_022864135.1 pentatricopeptide repeat-containing protein At1g11290, chloroplastic-like [Olea europaea var. sylvestris]